MHRRTFLGSVIGTLVTSGQLFKAEKAVYTVPNETKLDFAERMIKVFRVPNLVLYKYRLFIKTDEDIAIWSPSIKKVTRDFDKLTCEFQAEEIKIQQSITVTKVGLVNERGVLIPESSLYAMSPANRGDTFKALFILSMNL